MKLTLLFLLPLLGVQAAAPPPILHTPWNTNADGAPITSHSEITNLQPITVQGGTGAHYEGLNTSGLYITGPGGSSVVGRTLDIRNYGAKCDGTNDDAPSINAALSDGMRVMIPAGSTRIKSALLLKNNQMLEGAAFGGTVLIADGNFRALSLIGSSGSYLSNITAANMTIICTNGSGNSCGISGQWVNSSRLDNIRVYNAALNGIELLNCNHIVKSGCAVFNTGAFGHFFYKSFDCVDIASYASNTTLWSWEYKDCKRNQSFGTHLVNSHDYGVLIFTGFDANLIPGDVLSEENTFYGLHIDQASFTKNAIQIYGSPRNTFYSPVIHQTAGAWTPIELSASTFYNETGTNIVGSIASGSTNLVGVTGGSPIQPGDRIHIGGVSGNFTVYTNTGTTISLTSAVGTGYTNALIGWVALSSETRIINADITCAGNSDGINIASPAGDGYKGVVVDGGQIRWAGSHGINLFGNLDVTLNNVIIENSTNNNILADSSNVKLNGITARNGSTDSILIQNGATVIASDCIVTNSGNVGVYCVDATAKVMWTGGRIDSSINAAAILQGQSSLIGAEVSNSRWATINFDSQVLLFGTNNVVANCVFNPGTSVALDGHIKEKTVGTWNSVVGNSYNGVVVPINYSAGSTTPNLSVPGTLGVTGLSTLHGVQVLGGSAIPSSFHTDATFGFVEEGTTAAFTDLSFFRQDGTFVFGLLTGTNRLRLDGALLLHSTTATPTATQMQLGGSGLWSSNGVPFLSYTSDGSTVISKNLATAELDPTVKVDSADTGAGYLGAKLVAGSNISIVTNNVGGVESLTVSSTGGGGSGPTNLVFTPPLTLSGTNVYIATNGIGNIHLRQSAATSVIGRFPNSTGTPGDIDATADGQFLQRFAAGLEWNVIRTGVTTQKVSVAKSAVVAGSRSTINLIQGTNVTMTVADNAGTDSIDVTINASGPAGGIGSAADLILTSTANTDFVGGNPVATVYSNTTIGSTNLSLTLPAAGTYQVMACIGVHGNDIFNDWFKFRNTTVGTDASPEFQGSVQANTSQTYRLTLQKIITTSTGSNVIQVQGKSEDATYGDRYLVDTSWISYVRLQ